MKEKRVRNSVGKWNKWKKKKKERKNERKHIAFAGITECLRLHNTDATTAKSG